MSNILPENIVRIVVREWLASKEQRLNVMLERIVQKIVPVAQAEAEEGLRRVLSGDWRDELIQEFIEHVDALNKTCDYLIPRMDEIEDCHVVHGEIQRLSIDADWRLVGIKDTIEKHGDLSRFFWPSEKTQGGAS